MPFGLKNGPSVFQRFITAILSEMIRAREIIVYLDDLLVATVTPHEHLVILEKLFKLLSENGLELKINKCHFMQESIDYLGYSADRKGIRPNESHIKTLKDYPIPTTSRELQSCLGLFSYFRRFVPNFSRIAVPLYDHLRQKDRKKNSLFHLTEDARKSFLNL